MKQLFWVNGRLSWPFVIASVYLSLSLIVLDYVWRVVSISFDTLLIYATIADLAIAITLKVIYRAVRA